MQRWCCRPYIAFLNAKDFKLELMQEISKIWGVQILPGIHTLNPDARTVEYVESGSHGINMVLIELFDIFVPPECIKVPSICPPYVLHPDTSYFLVFHMIIRFVCSSERL